MNIYKLKYENKESGIADLIEKGIINEELQFLEGTIAVVYIGELVDSYDEENNPIYMEGYHIDLMLEQEKEFDNVVFPKSPKHMFAGCENLTPIEEQDINI